MSHSGFKYFQDFILLKDYIWRCKYPLSALYAVMLLQFRASAGVKCVWTWFVWKRSCPRIWCLSCSDDSWQVGGYKYNYYKFVVLKQNRRLLSFSFRHVQACWSLSKQEAACSNLRLIYFYRFYYSQRLKQP